MQKAVHNMIDKLRCTAYGILLTLALSVVNRGVFGQALVSAEDTTAAVQDTPKAGGEESAVGSGMAAIAGRPRQQALSDLTIGNFFAAGWDEDFAMRKRETGTLDLPLLRVQSNEMLRLFRTNYYYQNDLNSATKKVLADVDGFIDVALDRRIMVEVNGVYQWSYPTSGLATSGGAPGFLTRIQLVDTESSSLCANFKVVAPNPALGTYDSTVSYGLAGFQDLAYWLNLDRVGLYYSLSFDSLAGPAAAGAQRNDVQWDISVGKSFTAADAPVFRKFTVFEENFVQTVLDGPTTGRTFFTMTPGFRFDFGTSENSKKGTDSVLIFGTDIPVSGYQPWALTWRCSLIKCF